MNFGRFFENKLLTVLEKKKFTQDNKNRPNGEISPDPGHTGRIAALAQVKRLCRCCCHGRLCTTWKKHQSGLLKGHTHTYTSNVMASVMGQ
jgi:hypothetical protein